MVFSAVKCIDRHMPPMNSTGMMNQSDVSGENNAQAAIKIALRMPLTTSTGLKPKRLRIGVVPGFIARLPAKTAKVSMPA